MKRLVVLSIVVVCLLAAGLASLPYVVSSQSIKNKLDQKIAELTGGKVTYNGSPKLSFNPFLGIELSNVELRGNANTEDKDSLLNIETLQFQLKPLSILVGNIQLANFKFIRPKLKLTLNSDGSSNWGIISDKFDKSIASDSNNVENQQSLASKEIEDIEIGEFEIVDGIVDALIDTNTVRITNFSANVAWPNLRSPSRIKGKGVWRGEAFEFENSTRNPLAIFTSGKSELKMSFTSPTLTAAFDGEAIMVSGIQLQGKAKVNSPSLPRLSDLLLPEEMQINLPIGEFQIEGDLSANSHEVRFSKANITLNNSLAIGNLQLFQGKDKRPKISGTMAFANLDMTPFIDSLSVTVNPKSENQENSVKSSSANPAFDLDVRFSSKNYKIDERDYGGLAATVIISENEWSFDIGEADFFGGMIIATISSKEMEKGKTVELKGIMRKVSMGKLTSEWYGGEIIASGKTDVNFDLKAPGTSALNNIREFSGKMKITMTNGQIEGVDLVKAIPALRKNNGFVTVDEIKGSTPFGNLSLDLIIYNGVGWITKGKANSDKNDFNLSGKADLLGGGLAINAEIRGKAISSDNPPRNARIFVGGSVRNPLVTRSPLAQNRVDKGIPTDG